MFFFTTTRLFPRALASAAAVGCLLAAGMVGSVSAGRASGAVGALSSTDNTVSVYASSAKGAEYRGPVLIFIGRTREALQRTVRLKLGSQLSPLEVAIGNKGNGDTRVLTSRLKDADGTVRERIELPDPEAADLTKFRRAVCVAFLRGWMVDAGGTEATMRDLPAWLIDGVVRSMDRGTRLADVDRVMLLWSHACLPAASELLAADSLAATREPAVAAMLAAWFLEKRSEGPANPFEELLRSAAKGTAWSPEYAGKLLARTVDPVAVDEALDHWLLQEGRQVVQVGVTTDGIERRFRAHLLLYPSEYGKTFDVCKPALTFQEAAILSNDPAIRRGASVKSTELTAAAVGRDGMLLAVAEAYAHFLNALSKGEKEGELTRLLLDAERMRGKLEQSTHGGAVLKQPRVN